ncbi:MAG TPA: HEAT repeat domain-containing protein [Thermomicrobiales bacterium]|nr:HEAT repeat domain-containing protein [Thermomicrobiales bacterium]
MNAYRMAAALVLGLAGCLALGGNLRAAETDLVWGDDLEAAYRAARAKQGEVLVRVGAEWCGWCEKLSEELDKPEVQEQLRRFTLVYLDADDEPEAVRKLGVGPIPALRLLTAEGKVAAMHDGYLPAEKLIDWLKEASGAKAAEPPAALTASGPPDESAVGVLLAELARRETVRREAAIRRLLPHPDASAPQIVSLLTSPKLAARLSALELLAAWRAPLEGLDPWRAETITESRLAALNGWAENASALPEAETLAPDELAAAQGEIDKLLAADATEAEALAARLARYGRALAPEVYARLRQADNDRDRERLTWLRYRLAATDALALGWPGGLARLAANDSAVRRQAAQELVARATPDDEPLLMEMFSDPDPLVREMSLKALHGAGGERVSKSLVRLLDDPEPNVRAAVLKQLAESPTPAIVPPIAKYVAAEQDADLVVHAVRLLRAAGGKNAIDALMKLLSHASWRVRAEAAEALGECTSSSHDRQISESLKADVYIALIDALDDEDGFVVSRAMLGLKHADVPAMIEPLAAAAEKRPELARTAAEAMLGGQNARGKALTRLERWSEHADADLRAAAVIGLTQGSEAQPGEIYRKGLTDESAKVRIVAAQTLFKSFESKRPYYEEMIGKEDADLGGEMKISDSIVVISTEPAEADLAQQSERATLWGGLKRLFFGGKRKIAEGAAEPPNFGTLAERLAFAEGSVEAAPDASEPTELSAEETASDDPFGDPVDEPTPQPGRAKLRGNRPEPVEVPVEVETPTVVEIPKPPVATSPGAPKRGKERPDPWEPWLEEFRGNERRRRRAEPLIEPLTKMLAADDRDERLAAALALVPLAHEQEALPVLRELATADHKSVGEAGAALAWLPWQSRLAWFNELRQLAPDLETELALAQRFVVLRDLRGDEPLWQMLGGEPMSAAGAQSLLDDLKRVYRVGLPNYAYYNQTPPPPQLDVEKAKRFAREGASWQRLTALSLLLAADEEATAEIARAIYEDQSQSDADRQDALQFLLLAEKPKEARRLALDALRGELGEARRLALGYLARGKQSLASFRNGEFRVEREEHPMMMFSGLSDAPAASEVPEELTAADVRPFLADADGALAAFAGYLLAELGEPEGLEPLLKQWRAEGAASSLWTPLVYRAIAALNDGRQAGLLADIYDNIEHNSVNVKDFYWTIRKMDGPEVLKLRKRIRDEVGMERLR